MKPDKILSLVGLATRAGKTASGEFCTEKEVIYFYKDKDTLGHAMGKKFRASLAILDEGFAKEIMKQMKTEDNTVA